MKRLAPLALALLCAAPLAACSDGSGNQSAPAEAPATAASTSYTMADVNQHNTKDSCWTAIDGKVYDVTSWIGQHPGGAQRIENLCGTDGSGAFNGQHAKEDDPHKRLASFQVGVLKG
ncbi:cytochrome b5 domain-containing protein [Mobilicoccus massiliensis]|uniref:cytochrome b5 domain-containing protein n=1 Tax=Mobilicoccus massiliensis TaxID=1522310 RepID=UPI0006949227|nr:cytochrome b5-like heme/steroid binding domain-containing protein [Mobilicoccus massiliensis]